MNDDVAPSLFKEGFSWRLEDIIYKFKTVLETFDPMFPLAGDGAAWVAQNAIDDVASAAAWLGIANTTLRVFSGWF